jgi:mannose-6-phosphate isomerase-like protein (cupin superfamily)
MGPSSQEATTDDKGEATIRPLTAGNDRVRVEHEGQITLEKELTVRAGAVTEASFALSLAPVEKAPPPPPPPPPPPAPAPPPLGARGEPRTLSLTDLAEKSLDGRDPLKVVPIACTGNTATRLIVLRDALPPAAYEDAEETLYLMAGEASLSMGGTDQALSPGWLSVIPRGTSFGISRKGRNPALLLSVLNGRPCPADTTASMR